MTVSTVTWRTAPESTGSDAPDAGRGLRGAGRGAQMRVRSVHELGADGVAIGFGQGGHTQLTQGAAGVHLVQALPNQRGAPAARAARTATVERSCTAAQHERAEIGHARMVRRTRSEPSPRGRDVATSCPVVVTYDAWMLEAARAASIETLTPR